MGSLPYIVIRMTCHMFSIHSSVQMDILFRGSAASVPQDGLGDIHACVLIDLGGSGMAEEMAVKMFVNGQAFFSRIKDVLNRSWGYAFISFGEKKRPHLSVRPLQIFIDVYAENLRYGQRPSDISLFTDPEKTVGQ